MTHRRIGIGVCLLACLTALVLAGCGSSDDSGSDTSGGSGGSSGEAYTIGVATAQTGLVAPFDQPFLKGLKLRTEQINAEGGLDGEYPVELEIKDGQSEAAQTVAVAQELIDNGVDFLILPCDGDLATAAGQIAQAEGVPAMSSCASVPTLTENVGDYMFGNYFGDNADAAVAAEYAYDQGKRTAFTLSSKDNSYTQGVPDYWTEAFEKLGGKVVGNANYTIGQTDFNVIVSQIKNMQPQPDVIFTAAFEPDFPAFVKQLRGAGVDIPVYGADAVDTPGVYALGSMVDGSVITAPAFADSGNEYDKFAKAYEKKYGSAPEAPYTAVGGDALNVISAALAAAGSTEPEAVAKAMASLEDVPGITGPITYAGTERMPLKTVYVLEIQDGAPHLVEQKVPTADQIPAPEAG